MANNGAEKFVDEFEDFVNKTTNVFVHLDIRISALENKMELSRKAMTALLESMEILSKKMKELPDG